LSRSGFDWVKPPGQQQRMSETGAMTVDIMVVGRPTTDIIAALSPNNC
jgi:hypothetical protein